jgi:hypothetical protein
METFSEKVRAVGLMAFILMMVVAIGYPIMKVVTADGRISYCYVGQTVYQDPNSALVVKYHLYGSRSWRDDRLIAMNLKDMDEVKENAAKYGCELR